MYVYDTRHIKGGDFFICLPGGERYCKEALERGAKDIVYMTRSEMALFSSELNKHPSNDLIVVGITGTNGKTSVAHFVGEALLLLDCVPKVQGTLSTVLTTPESLDTQRAMREHLDKGGTHFIMEVSSHGIAQSRVEGIDFDVKCLTNISQDHLDYHQTVEAYRQVKMDFISHYPGNSILEKDYQEVEMVAHPFLSGTFNELNLKAAAAILLELGFEKDRVYHALKRVSAVKGRYELIDSDTDFDVVVDFAHTPEGLDIVLEYAKQQAELKKWAVACLF